MKNTTTTTDLNKSLKELIEEIHRLNERRFQIEIGDVKIDEELLKKQAELLQHDCERMFNNFREWFVNRSALEILQKLEQYIEYQVQREVLGTLFQEYKKILGAARSIASKVEEINAVYVENGPWNIEDRHLYPVLRWIEKVHGLERMKVILHGKVKIGSRAIEFDALLFGKTEGDHPRVIGIEFKDSDVWKLTEQAITRSLFVHYQYAVVHRSPFSFLDTFYDKFDELVRNGIGVITVIEDEGKPYVIPLRKARYNPKIPDDLKTLWEAVMKEGWRLKDAQRLKEYRTLTKWLKEG